VFSGFQSSLFIYYEIERPTFYKVLTFDVDLSKYSPKEIYAISSKDGTKDGTDLCDYSLRESENSIL
jgi:hypothetical protein